MKSCFYFPPYTSLTTTIRTIRAFIWNMGLIVERTYFLHNHYFCLVFRLLPAETWFYWFDFQQRSQIFILSFVYHSLAMGQWFISYFATGRKIIIEFISSSIFISKYTAIVPSLSSIDCCLHIANVKKIIPKNIILYIVSFFSHFFQQ